MHYVTGDSHFLPTCGGLYSEPCDQSCSVIVRQSQGEGVRPTLGSRRVHVDAFLEIVSRAGVSVPLGRQLLGPAVAVEGALRWHQQRRVAARLRRCLPARRGGSARVVACVHPW